MPVEDLPVTMMAAVLEQFNEPYQVKQVPIPASPEDHDLLIQVLAASYCHTDMVFASGAMSRELPRIGCHEFAGRIVAMGPNVSASLQLSIGMELDDGGSKGFSAFCPNSKSVGIMVDGGFSEYAIVDSRQVAPIPQGLTALQTAPLMCAGVTIWSAIERVGDAQSVAILGAGGGLGHLGVQYAAHLGMKVIAIDIGQKPVELLDNVVNGLGDIAKNVTVVDAGKHDSKSILEMIGEVGKSEGENGIDAAIFLPDNQAAFDMGIALLRRHGTMVVVSFPDEPLKVSAKDLVNRDIKLVGNFIGSHSQVRKMLDFSAKHGVKAVTKSFPLGSINQLVQQSHHGAGGKLIIDMTLKP